MNKLIKTFGDYIYKLTPKNPNKTMKTLITVYDISGKMCKYFPTDKLLPARQYMQWAAANSTVQSLKNPSNSSIVSLFLPCEIFHAFGINTMFPEAISCYLAAAASEKIFIETAENNNVPKTFCSYHKALIGMVETNVLPKPLFIVNTTLACDANQVSFRRIAEYYSVNQFVIDVPKDFNQTNVDYVANQLRQLVTFVENETGKKLDNEKLKEIISSSKRTMNNYKEILNLRANRYLSDEMTSEMLSIFALHVMLGTKEAELYTNSFLEQLKKQPQVKKGVRLLWVHTLPYWQDELRDLINFNQRCEIVACDMTFDAISDDDENEPYEYMAKRLLSNTFNGENSKRLEKILEYSKKLNVDGIIWYCQWGCKQTSGSSQMAKKLFEKNGYPTLILDGDGCDHNNVNDGQTVTRVEAFLELLEGMK